MITSRNILGFSVAPNMCRVMEANGFYASIMKSEKRKDDDGGLPSGMPIPVMPVDFLKDRPDFWVGGIGSFCCPVESDWGLWFNWTMNISNIAVLSSVKGMNPITGQRVNGLELEQYKEQCPIHKVKFQHGKFCPKCNFKWPDQNYITEPNLLYWDGFRTADGQVRQFYFTEDLAKSVPELVIGKDDTVPAFGFCFYMPKKVESINYEGGKRLKNKFLEIEKMTVSSGSSLSMGMVRGMSIPGVYTKMVDDTYKHSSSVYYASLAPICMDMCNNSYVGSTVADGASTKFSLTSSADINAYNVSDVKLSLETSELADELILRERSENAEVGIGAGAKLKQSLMQDVRTVDSWQNKPAGVIRVYFVFREQFERYVSAGLNNLAGHKEGYLSDLPVGGNK